MLESATSHDHVRLETRGRGGTQQPLEGKDPKEHAEVAGPASQRELRAGRWTVGIL